MNGLNIETKEGGGLGQKNALSENGKRLRELGRLFLVSIPKRFGESLKNM